MITDTTANAMMDAITLDLCSLHTAYSATGANKVAGGAPAYADKAITMGAAASRQRTNTTAPVFDVPASTTVAFIGLWTAAGAVFRGMWPNGGSEKGFQIDVANNQIECEGHGLVDNDRVTFIGGTPPAPLVEGTVYWVVTNTAGDPDTFQVSSTQGGGPIDITTQHAATCKLSKVVLETFASQGTFTINNSQLTVGIIE